jgi:hypothetical protein
MVGDTNDLARLNASRLLLQRQSSELHGHLILLELDGRQGTLLGSPAVPLPCSVQSRGRCSRRQLRPRDRADTGGMTYVGTRPPHALRYHKSGGSSRFSSASTRSARGPCASASSDRTCSEPRAHPCRRRAAAWVARKWTRWRGQVLSRRAAGRCSHDHVDIRCISGHLEDLGGICAAPSALGRHMPAAQLQARGITEILTAAAKNAFHTSGRSGALPPSLSTASRVVRIGSQI